MEGLGSSTRKNFAEKRVDFSVGYSLQFAVQNGREVIVGQLKGGCRCQETQYDPNALILASQNGHGTVV